MIHVVEKLEVSERRACHVLLQPRTTQRYEARPNELTEAIRPRVIELAKEYGRYGYRKVTDLLNMEGIDVGKDRVYTIWREEGLKVLKISRSAQGYGSMMAVVCVESRYIRITYGVMILCLSVLMMVEGLRYSTSSMNIRGSACALL